MSSHARVRGCWLILCVVCMFAVGCNAVSTNDVKIASAAGASSPPGSKMQEEVAEDWPNGKPRLRKRVLHRADGTIADDGMFTRWHENGNKEYEGEFVDGKKNGRHVRYHMNGRMWNESFYVDGKRQGFSRQWDEKGSLMKEESYDQGLPHGTWTTWNSKGKIKWQGRFDHGKPVDDRPAPQE